MVAGWVREALSEVRDTDDPYASAKYHRQKYGKLLLGLEAETLDDETFLQICRETNRISDAVVYLLKNGRSDEAAKEAAQAEDMELFKMIDFFVEFGHDAVIERV